MALAIQDPDIVGEEVKVLQLRPRIPKGYNKERWDGVQARREEARKLAENTQLTISAIQRALVKKFKKGMDFYALRKIIEENRKTESPTAPAAVTDWSSIVAQLEANGVVSLTKEDGVWKMTRVVTTTI